MKRSIMMRLWMTCSAPTFVASALALTTISCADEKDPATWAKRLDDPAQRATAVDRLSAAFEGAMGNAGSKLEDPGVQKVLDVIVEPLTKQYTAATLDEKTRKKIINLLGDTRDPRAGAAFAKALTEYEPGKNDDDVKFSAQAITGIAKDGRASKLDKSVIDSVWACFARFQPSKAKSLNLVKDLANAVIALKDPSWAPKAIEKISANVTDPKNPTEGLDQIQFWQATSIRLLGELKSKEAVRPLVKVLLTPTKGDLRGTANNVLLKLPVESETVLVGALSGSDAELAKMGEAFGPDKTHRAILADTLAYISRPKGLAAILDLLPKAENETQRTVMAQALIRYPSDKKVIDAFIGAYGKIPANTAIALLGGVDAHAALAQASSHFYDPTLVAWLIKEINSAKGEQADAIHLYALEAAIKLMTADQMKEVGGLVDKFGTPREKEMFKNSSAALTKCNKDAACYVAILDESIPPTPDTAKYKHVKASWMAAIYGDEKTKQALVAKVDKVKDGGIRLGMVEAIDHLAPKGDEASAKALDKVVDGDIASGNQALIASDDAVVKVAHKLRARALP